MHIKKVPPQEADRRKTRIWGFEFGGNLNACANKKFQSETRTPHLFIYIFVSNSSDEAKELS